MSRRYTASFILYLLFPLTLFGFAVRYFFAAELTSYHAAALGQTLAGMAPNQQITFLTLYRVVGAGMFSTSVALAFVLWFPFRRGEVWARWALTVSGFCFGGMSLYATLAFKAATGIDAPWPAVIANLVIIAVAHVLASEKVKA